MNLSDTQNVIRESHYFNEMNYYIDKLLNEFPNITEINININTEEKALYSENNVIEEVIERTKKYKFSANDKETTINTTFEIPVEEDRKSKIEPLEEITKLPCIVNHKSIEWFILKHIKEHEKRINYLIKVINSTAEEGDDIKVTTVIMEQFKGLCKEDQKLVLKKLRSIFLNRR